jgi:hypothetical protein
MIASQEQQQIQQQLGPDGTYIRLHLAPASAAFACCHARRAA